MSFNRISAAEAASLIKHGYNIGLSGFTPAGTAKAVTAELAKIAEAEHAKGNPFQVGIFTGASTGESCDGVLARAKAIRYRAPYTTNSDFRKAVNNRNCLQRHTPLTNGTGSALRLHGESERSHYRSLRTDSGRQNISDGCRRYLSDYLPFGRPDHR